MFSCYLLTWKRSLTYVGMTNNFQRRIRQHNQELVGGAKYTSQIKPDQTNARPWQPVVVVDGFPELRDALQFEWRWKQLSRLKVRKQYDPVTRRILALGQIISDGYSTRQSKRFNVYSNRLKIRWGTEPDCLRKDRRLYYQTNKVKLLLKKRGSAASPLGPPSTGEG